MEPDIYICFKKRIKEQNDNNEQTVNQPSFVNKEYFKKKIKVTHLYGFSFVCTNT
jgi:hypothetical protein